MSAPADIEFHRGLKWLQSPEESQSWAFFIAQLGKNGLDMPPHFNKRRDVCLVDRIVSRLESYKYFYPPAEQAEARERFLAELEPLLLSSNKVK